MLPLTLYWRKIYFVAIYALLCGEKFIQKLCLWRKKDKYQVCIDRTPETPGSDKKTQVLHCKSTIVRKYKSIWVQKYKNAKARKYKRSEFDSPSCHYLPLSLFPVTFYTQLLCCTSLTDSSIHTCLPVLFFCCTGQTNNQTFKQ